MEVRVVRYGKDGTERDKKTFIHFIYGKRKMNNQLGTEFSYKIKWCQHQDSVVGRRPI
jgi:hypothetical protein